MKHIPSELTGYLEIFLSVNEQEIDSWLLKIKDPEKNGIERCEYTDILNDLKPNFPCAYESLSGPEMKDFLPVGLTFYRYKNDFQYVGVADDRVLIMIYKTLNVVH